MDLSQSPTSQPLTHGSASPGSLTGLEGSGRKRKFGVDEAGDDGHEDRSKPASKRACNECKQQKLRCDVHETGFCSRCRKLKLECRIDANFKRIGKRSKNAEMEREIVELRRQLAEKDGSPSNTTSAKNSPVVGDHAPRSKDIVAADNTDAITALHQGAVGSLLDLRNSRSTEKPKSYVLGDIGFDLDRINQMFRQYFTDYHPHLPVLDPEKSPVEYHELSPLLFWTVIAIAARRFPEDPTLLTGLKKPLMSLVWSTMASVPQNYHIVKALCILCTWPMPTTSTSTDPTFMLSGLMLQIALQTGLHQPSHVQDFSRVRIELREDDICDRLQTWTACNIVLQNISTGYGQPPKTLYDGTLSHMDDVDPAGHEMPKELSWRLRIEKFVNKITKLLYTNNADPLGITGGPNKMVCVNVLTEELAELERQVSQHGSAIDNLHLKAAALHIHLSTFFDSNSSPNYTEDMSQLFLSTEAFLKFAFDFESRTGHSLKTCGFYIMQMILAAGFSLMKLLNSFFARHIDIVNARKLFSRTIYAIRDIGITNNDLPGRLAEVLAQLWRSHGAGTKDWSGATEADSTLQLKVRSRMSMSLIFDSVWRWREEFQLKPDAPPVSLDKAVNNPTNPDVAHEGTNISSNVSSVGPENGVTANLSDDIGYRNGNAAASLGDALITRTVTPLQQSMSSTLGGPDPTLMDFNYEVFDPLTWMLDSSNAALDFPFDSPTFGTDINGSGPGMF